MKKLVIFLFLTIIFILMAGCGSAPTQVSPTLALITAVSETPNPPIQVTDTAAT